MTHIHELILKFKSRIYRQPPWKLTPAPWLRRWQLEYLRVAAKARRSCSSWLSRRRFFSSSSRTRPKLQLREVLGRTGAAATGWLLECNGWVVCGMGRKSYQVWVQRRRAHSGWSGILRGQPRRAWKKATWTTSKSRKSPGAVA